MVVPVGRLGVVALSAARSTHQQALGGRAGTIGSMHRQRKKESPAGAGRVFEVSTYPTPSRAVFRWGPVTSSTHRASDAG